MVVVVVAHEAVVVTGWCLSAVLRLASCSRAARADVLITDCLELIVGHFPDG